MSKKYLSMVTSVVTGLSMIFGTVSGAFAAEEEPFEIVSLRSEYEKHFDNGDGTITAFVNTVPIHYLENGE